jgi:hypothetical protein
MHVSIRSKTVKPEVIVMASGFALKCCFEIQ